MLTATRWWGYIILIPCIIASIYSNYVWRKKIGYTRAILQDIPDHTISSLVAELESTTNARKVLAAAPPDLLAKLFPDSGSMENLMNMIIINGLFEDFCYYILDDRELSLALFETLGDKITIQPYHLLVADKSLTPQIFEVAQRCLAEKGPQRLRDQQRYLLEILGCCMSSTEDQPDAEEKV